MIWSCEAPTLSNLKVFDVFVKSRGTSNREQDLEKRYGSARARDTRTQESYKYKLNKLNLSLISHITPFSKLINRRK